MPAYGNFDAEVNNQISRYDFAQVLACARPDALIRPVVLAYVASSGFGAGTVLAQYTSGPSANFFGPYTPGGASGLATPMCILLVDAVPVVGVNSGTVLVPAVYTGAVYYSAVSGTLDAAAVTGLKGRIIGDAVGTNQIFIF